MQGWGDRFLSLQPPLSPARTFRIELGVGEASRQDIGHIWGMGTICRLGSPGQESSWSWWKFGPGRVDTGGRLGGQPRGHGKREQSCKGHVGKKQIGRLSCWAKGRCKESGPWEGWATGPLSRVKWQPTPRAKWGTRPDPIDKICLSPYKHLMSWDVPFWLCIEGLALNIPGQ